MPARSPLLSGNIQIEYTNKLFLIFLRFVRLQAMVKSVKLKEIIDFIYERAKTPREKQPKIDYAAPDPEGVKNCNLEQDAIDNLSIIDSQKIIDNKIIFTDILESTYQKLTDFLHEKLSENEIEY